MIYDLDRAIGRGQRAVRPEMRQAIKIASLQALVKPQCSILHPDIYCQCLIVSAATITRHSARLPKTLRSVGGRVRWGMIGVLFCLVCGDVSEPLAGVNQSV